MDASTKQVYENVEYEKIDCRIQYSHAEEFKKCVHYVMNNAIKQSIARSGNAPLKHYVEGKTASSLIQRGSDASTFCHAGTMRVNALPLRQIHVVHHARLRPSC